MSNSKKNNISIEVEHEEAQASNNLLKDLEEQVKEKEIKKTTESAARKISVSKRRFL